MFLCAALVPSHELVSAQNESFTLMNFLEIVVLTGTYLMVVCLKMTVSWLPEGINSVWELLMIFSTWLK